MPGPESSSMELLALCETLKGNAADVADRIIDRWQEIARSEPWLALPPDLDFDHLPDLIRELAGAALCTEFDRALCEGMVATAARHGEHRGREGFAEDLLYREYHLLRRAMAERMKRDHGESAVVYLATMRLDTLTSLSEAAALHGLHRERLEESRPWSRVVDELMDGWPLPFV
jgi:hypothetical protein